MTQLDPDDIALTTRGSVTAAGPAYAREKIAKVAALLRDPVLHAEVELVQEANPSVTRPSIAEATFDVNGRPVRAHVAAGEMHEAIDLLADRLASRLRRFEEKAHREGRERHRTGEQVEGAWRHGDQPTQRVEYFDRPRDDRELVRTKTFDLTPMTVDEAAFDLDMLGHDFYLFTEEQTGADAVIFFRDGRPLGLQLPDGAAGEPGGATAADVEVVAAAPRLAQDEAIERLESGKERFVFYVDSETERGAVLYHRYDGNWGLISAD